MTARARWFHLIAILPLLPLLGKAQPPPPWTGETLLKADCIAVFAHPDDETGMAPTLATYALAENRRIVHVYCTRGEGGGNMVGRQWGPSLGILRESELRACLKELGVERVYFLEQRDWAYTESAQMTQEVWNRDEALEKLVRLFRLTRPEIVLTMNPTPNPGQHGHHQAAGILATEAFELAADPNAFPDQIKKEGVEPWQARKLYIGASPDPYGATMDSTQNLPGGQVAAAVAAKALSNHRSQGFGGIAESPWMARPRSYRLILSTVGYAETESDLFRGLQNPSALPALMPVEKSPPEREPSNWRFKARPAIERFRGWAASRGVYSLTDGLKSDLPVPSGHWIDVELIPSVSGEKVSWPKNLTIETPEGWRLEFLPATTFNDRIVHRIHAPANAKEPVTLSAEWTDEKGFNREELTLNPVAAADLFMSASMGPSESSEVDWVAATRLEIPSVHAWQGQADDEADCSATAWIRAYSDLVWIRIAVNDDRIVNNIAPNDIRGHWRSDSVEICFDPVGGSEHTLNTFKAGIFPFDSEGHVRAARDADANQGPIEETAPEMRLFSQRSDSGYVIEASIPWSTLGLSPDYGDEIGFNLLIYDGDKPEASPGENINECRLAWSPARGVQGRPEDWGRLFFR